MNNDGKTQHQKLDKVIEITTDIRIRLGVIEERQSNAKTERKEMKDNIKDNTKLKRVSHLWDGVNSFLIGLGTYFGLRQ